MVESSFTGLASAFFISIIGAAACQAQTTPMDQDDCAFCPDMVTIPAGSFLMGSSDAERAAQGVPARHGVLEHPQIKIQIAKPFALSRTEITVEQYAAFIEDTGHPAQACEVFLKEKGTYVGWLPLLGSSWDKPPFAQRPDHPVTCVLPEDATAFAAWLSAKTGDTYRLPSETEWEYAARAGTRTARYWGDGFEDACDYANVADVNSYRKLADCDDGYSHTAPATFGRPNAFGLHGMLGNVGEWVADCGLSDYATQTPRDGSPYVSEDCSKRVGRGGSWWNNLYYIRSARRYASEGAYYVMGFRVAMEPASK